MNARPVFLLTLILLLTACSTTLKPPQEFHQAETDPRIIVLICSRVGVSQVRALLDKDPGLVRARDHLQRTPLFYAAMYSDMEMIRLLVEKGAEVDEVCDDNMTPLVPAAGNGKTEVVRYFLEKGANVEGANIRNTPLQAACQNNYGEVVETLLTAGATYDLKSALLFWDENQVEAILKNAPKNFDWPSIIRKETLFNIACERGRLKNVALLFSKFPFPNEVNRSPDYVLCPPGSPPLWFALEHPDITRFLLEKGADPKFPGLVFQAVFQGKVESLRMLIARGADVNAVGRECRTIGMSDPPGGYTPLQWAAGHGMLEIVRMLIDSKAEVNAKHHFGTALSMAEQAFSDSEAEHDEIMRLLRAAGGK